MPTYRVWAAKKHGDTKIDIEVEADSGADAILDVMSRPETIVAFGGALPLFGAELVYCPENLPLLAKNGGHFLLQGTKWQEVLDSAFPDKRDQELVQQLLGAALCGDFIGGDDPASNKPGANAGQLCS